MSRSQHPAPKIAAAEVNLVRRRLVIGSAARLFPPLGPNAVLQQSDPLGLEHLILAGARIGTSPTHPSPFAMPSFAWKLTDQEVADVATYLRNSWGNAAAAVSASDVRAARKKLNLDTCS
jgi:mono/diheme cytochrome c family protein